MADMQSHTVRPDAKGRIALGTFAKGVSSYRIYEEENGRLILEPYAEVPAKELWLFDNRQARRQVQKGLQDAAKGDVSTRGDFSHYLDEKLD